MDNQISGSKTKEVAYPVWEKRNSHKMGKSKWFFFIVIFFLVQFNLYLFCNEKKENDYVSLQLCFIDYYSEWTYLRFYAYDSYSKQYKWLYDEHGNLGGYLEFNMGICWKHFFSNRIFGELSLTTGVYSLEKSTVYRSYMNIFSDIRIPPLEYIAQAGIGYCFFNKKKTHAFLEISGSYNLLRCWPQDSNVYPEQIRGNNFSWRGELGIILDLKKNFFLEAQVGLFVNSNYYHNSGHQVRVGIGKFF